MNYHHLSIEERSCIRKYYVDGTQHRRSICCGVPIAIEGCSIRRR